ncbi:MAG TPA: flagellar basal body P-ring formation chaperone FlgA [Anaerolineae bacterium]|nr:flagellar basal body P-ring formation chaperone FlgA [Anaerolineae bacterium]
MQVRDGLRHLGALALLALGALAPLQAAARTAVLPASPGPVVVELRPFVQVSGRQVRLGDVAARVDASPELAARLSALPLGAAPLLSERQQLSRRILAAHVGRQLGLRTPIRWEGAETVQIERAQQQLAGVELLAPARLSLEAWLASRAPARYELEPGSVTDRLALPAGRIELRARGIPAGQPPYGNLVVPVDVRVDEALVATLPVAFRVRAFARGLVALRELPAHGRIEPQDVALRELALGTGLTQVLAALPAQAQARQRIAAGQALQPAQVRAMPVVSQGQLVQLDMQQGWVRVQARAEALQDGYEGQRVQVRVAGATAPVSAQVVGNGLVRVVE